MIMAISHTKKFGIYHWDTFDNVTGLVGEADTLEEAKDFVQEKYNTRIRRTGADQVDIVDSKGAVRETYSVG